MGNALIKEEWTKSCDNLNAISDAKKYWIHFSTLVGTFKQKVYNDIKQNNKTATNDQERADFFANHMEKTCQTLTGPQFDNTHKITVDNFISNNPFIFKPLTSIEHENYNNDEKL